MFTVVRAIRYYVHEGEPFYSTLEEGEPFYSTLEEGESLYSTLEVGDLALQHWNSPVLLLQQYLHHTHILYSIIHCSDTHSSTVTTQ